MKEPKILLFDFGGVLVDLDRPRCVEAFAKIGIDIAPLLGTAHHGGAITRMEDGTCTTAEFCEALRKECGGSNASNADIIAAFQSFLLTIPRERLELLLRLKQHYRLALLSNTNAVHWQQAEDYLFRLGDRDVNDFFGDIFLSFKLHLQKPDRAIFEHVAEQLGAAPEDILFLDDSAANCEAARACGLRARLAPMGGGWMRFFSAEGRLLPSCVATVGFFDGVHRGHQFLLEGVRNEAQSRGCEAVAITFDRHPREVLQSGFQPQLLTTTSEKIAHIRDLGIDRVEVLPFTKDFAALSSEDFLKKYILERYNAECLVVGYDHHFGSDASAEFADYRRCGEALGVEVKHATAFAAEGADVSSSAIRKLLEAGDVEGAEHLLGHPYALEGDVTEGRQVGRHLGFPTANLVPNSGLKVVPRTGVYAVWAEFEGKRFPAMLNIGSRPTLHNGDDVSIEAHLLGFRGNAYGKTLRLLFKYRLRDEREFPSTEALKIQLELDAEQTLALLPTSLKNLQE